MPSVARMSWAFAALSLVMASAAMAARAPVPLYDSTSLNIGFNCRWQQACIAEQQRSMKRSLAYVKRHRLPAWRVHLCNRNASRGRNRVDWVGFDNCIRNTALRPQGRVVVKRHRSR